MGKHEYSTILEDSLATNMEPISPLALLSCILQHIIFILVFLEMQISSFLCYAIIDELLHDQDFLLKHCRLFCYIPKPCNELGLLNSTHILQYGQFSQK